MARIRSHLGGAPITEALIDLQVRPSNDDGLKEVQEFANSLEGYEQVGPIMRLQTTWELSKEGGAKEQSLSSELGVRLNSNDEKYVLQIRTNGFTLSRLEPYETWEVLLAEMRRLWSLYIDLVEPEVVTRVATRFINRLKLPMVPGEEFGDYLTKPPEVPEELPQAILSFMQRTVIPHPDNGVIANLIQLLEEGVTPDDHVPVMLDIDVYKMVNFGPDTEESWNLLETLRVYKNAIFFASLTEKTVELFE